MAEGKVAVDQRLPQHLRRPPVGCDAVQHDNDHVLLTGQPNELGAQHQVAAEVEWPLAAGSGQTAGFIQALYRCQDAQVDAFQRHV